jgi:hypothetical protein
MNHSIADLGIPQLKTVSSALYPKSLDIAACARTLDADVHLVPIVAARLGVCVSSGVYDNHTYSIAHKRAHISKL